MENKKLVKILLKDMEELEGLIADMKSSRRFDALETEFIHTRAKGVLQLLQLLGEREEVAPAEVPGENEKMEVKKKELTEMSREREEVQPDEEPVNEPREEIQPPEPEPVQEKVNGSDSASDVSEKKEEEESVAGNEKEKEDDGEMLEEEAGKTQANSRLGDSFLKEKSINDLITDQHKLEFKLSNRPVSSIQAAIGINDRFQYIRELFGGDNEKFMEAVKTLDSSKDIKEAVEYLRNNFKWKKNETSLKFVNLVKRRFQDTVDK